MKRSPFNEWEVWKDCTYRMTLTANLLHLVVWHEDALHDAPGWHFRIGNGLGIKLRWSTKSSPTRRHAARRAEAAAQELLCRALRDLEAVMGG